MPSICLCRLYMHSMSFMTNKHIIEKKKKKKGKRRSRHLRRPCMWAEFFVPNREIRSRNCSRFKGRAWRLDVWYRPGHWTDTKNWRQTCATCATRKTTGPRQRAPLHSIHTGSPMQLVAVDILGPLPESEFRKSYVLVAVDYFTRWMEAYAIPNQEATTVARKLVHEVLCRFSPLEQLHSILIRASNLSPIY